MKIDPVIAEVRKTREDLCRRFDNDPKKLFAHLRDRSAARAYGGLDRRDGSAGGAIAFREKSDKKSQ
jgi:hypothetical protein